MAPVEGIGVLITWTEATSIVERLLVNVVDELACTSDSILPLDSVDEVFTDEEVAPFCEFFNCSEFDASVDGEELIKAVDPSTVEATTEEKALRLPDNVKLGRSFGLVNRCSALPGEVVSV